MGFIDRLQHAWNAFSSRDPTRMPVLPGTSYSYRPDRPRLVMGNDRSMVASVINRIAMDVSAVDIKHARLDDNDRYLEEIKSGLDNCLTTEANVDQTGRALIQDIVMSMLDEGCVAVVPVDTDLNPNVTGSYDVVTLRTAKIIQWKPQHVQVRLYNDKTGEKQDVWLPKKMVAIIENPLYAVMNEPNSTGRRLMRKLALLDAVDEETSSGKLDLIIQLPYVIKTEARRQQAEQRRKDIESQLSGSKYGIAYTDGTERVTQLNRSLENNLLKQIEYLTDLFFSQLGITKEILNGSADERAMTNYNNRIIEPIVSAITDEFTRKFLTKTARSQRQRVVFFKDPFRLASLNDLVAAAGTLVNAAITSSNEMRQIIGMKPSDDPNADALANKNINPVDPTADPNALPPDSEYSTDDAGMEGQYDETADEPLDLANMSVEDISG